MFQGFHQNMTYDSYLGKDKLMTIHIYKQSQHSTDLGNTTLNKKLPLQYLNKYKNVKRSAKLEP